MLQSSRVVALTLVGAGLFMFTGFVLAGNLTPPAGPVVETFKTLTEVEPRIAVNAANTPGNASSVFVISKSGSYYLTGDVTGVAGKSGIAITAQNVTLDLNGYALLGVPGSINGVSMPLFRFGVVIRNGSVFSWPQSGLETRIDTGLIEDLVVTSCGGWGINNDSSSYSTRINNCQTSFNGEAIGSTGGINATQGVVTNCTSNDNAGAGIRANTGTVVRENRCRGNHDNALIGSTGRGIYVVGAGNVVENNLALSSPVGIECGLSGNMFVGNKVTACGTSYVMVASNFIRVVTAPAAGAFSGAAGGLQISTDPFANFSF